MTVIQYLSFGVGLLAIAGAATQLLQRHVRVQRVAAIAAAPADVMAMAASNIGYQKFNPYNLADAALKIELFGPEHGVGSGFRFASRDGKGSAIISKLTAHRVDYALDLGHRGKPQQSIAVEALGTGSKVTWTTEADMGFNPIGRIIGLFLDGKLGPVQERGIQNIAAALKS